VTNRLADSTSPYLQQHAGNPVDWWEWGDEAFAEARRRDVPLLLSVGYAACHWCHVMAHESFEDDATAAQMNAAFVNVKVDREERPDVDAVYMTATQALTGQGGWPMTVFLTPEGRPFYAGTYFPPRPAHGMPSFRQLLTAIDETWRGQRAEVEDAGSRISRALAEQTAFPTAGGPPDAAATEAAVRALAGAEDTTHGGFGGAPKFPPSSVCEFLLRHAARNRTAGSGAVAEGLASRTLAAMARSGMYDQVAGGFARYAVDRAWVVPHFEKMLYDNAQLARAYLHWWRLTGDATGARVAEETCDWMLAALRTDQGGFASSLDADTDGVEGVTYVWTPDELREVLGDADGAWAADLLGVTAGGTFEHGTSTARLVRDPWAEAAEGTGTADAARWVTVRARLRDVRAARPQPGRDDKIVAAWNGLAIAAFAEVGALRGRPELVAAAVRAAELLLGTHVVGGRLRRVSRDGVVGAPAGVLEDYGDVAEGLLALHAVTGEARWLAAAGELLDVVLADFTDGPAGGASWHDTAAGETDEALRAVRRPHDPTDNAYPSGTSAAAGALLSYAALTGSSRHRAAAESALGTAGAAAARAPQAFGWALAVAEALLDGPREVAVAGRDDDPARAALHAVALAAPAPGAVVSAGTPDTPGVPLLEGRTTSNGAAAAFVCRGFVCRLPTSDPAELAAQLA
jgi:uncharacterized protein YyaL (SSP411 family)